MTHLNSRQAEQLQRHLDEIPGLYLGLNDVAGTRRGTPGGGRRPPGSKPAADLTVVHLTDVRVKDWRWWKATDPREYDDLDRYGIIPGLGLWLRVIVDDMDDDPDATPLDVDDDDWRNIERLCHHLRACVPWMLGQEQVIELAGDMRKLHGQLERAHGIRREYRPRCRQLGCGAVLEPEDNGSWYRCGDCGRHYTVAEDLRALGQAQYLPSEDVAQLLDVKWSTFRSWVARGHIRPVATTAFGQALFDLDQVREVRDARRAEEAG